MVIRAILLSQLSFVLMHIIFTVLVLENVLKRFCIEASYSCCARAGCVTIINWITCSPLPWASGLPVAIQCAWNLDPSVHWNATGELPVCFQWSSSGFPVVFQCVPIMQINTGSPPGHHWVQASASVVPVASQCTCGSSGLPVCSNYAN